MPLAAVALVLASCGLHALWNLFVKQADDKEAFTALFLFAIPILYVPLFAVFLPDHLPSVSGWGCIVVAGLIYAAYFLGLARAYQGSELSVAYPLSRGLGPALTVLWGIGLLGERPSPQGWVGVALVLIGAWRLSQPTNTLVQWRALLIPALRPAWFVAAMYSAYSVIDKLAMSHLGIHPVVYIYTTYTLCALLVVPFVVWRKGWQRLRNEWFYKKWSCLGTALLNIAAYLLVLIAMSLPNTPVSYIVPLRSVGLLFGVWLGTEVLSEKGRWQKTLATITLVLGAILIAVPQ